MTDTIYRADAIEAVCSVVIDDFDVSPTWGYEVAEKALSALPSAEAKDCTDFLLWLLEEIMDEENWELNAVAGGEIIARKLKKLGLLEVKNGYYVRTGLTEALLAEAVQGWRTGKPTENGEYMVTLDAWGHRYIGIMHYAKPQMPNREVDGICWYRSDDEWGDVVYDDKDILAWMPLPKPYKGGDE